MSFEFDDDTAVEVHGPGRYGATVTGRWTVGGAVTGAASVAALVLGVLLAG